MEENKTGTNKLAERIIADAKDIADGILAKANADAMAYSADCMQKLNAKREELEQKRRSLVQGVIDGCRTRASIDGKKAALQKKRDVIDLVFENGYKAMCALSTEKRAEICTKLLQKEAEGGETVVPAAADRELIEKAVASLKSVKLTVSPEDAGIDNGFLLKGNGYEKDCSFRSILTLLRDLEETEVAKLLFN